MMMKDDTAPRFDWENLFRSMPPSDQIPEDLKGAVAQELAGQDPNRVAMMKVHEIVEILKGLPNTPEHRLIGIARRVRDFLKEMEFGSEQAPAQPASPGPMQVEVKFPKAPEQMSLRELLALLLEHPDQRPEILPYIERNNAVTRALQKTIDWVVPNADGHGIDIAVTIEYVHNLGRAFSRPQRTVGPHNQRPVSLRLALGIEDRPIFHPFLHRPVLGPDDNGFDFSRLDRELLRALLWAQVSPRHPSFPDPVDPVRASYEVFQKELPPWWQRILEDYREALRREQVTAIGISPYWPEDLAYDQRLVEHVHAGVPGQPQGIDYERLVRESAVMSGTLSVTGSGNDYTGGVYQRLSVNGSGHEFSKIVVVEGGSVNGSGHDGMVYLPPGVRLTINGSGHSITQRNMSWKDLAEKLGLT